MACHAAATDILHTDGDHEAARFRAMLAHVLQVQPHLLSQTFIRFERIKRLSRPKPVENGLCGSCQDDAEDTVGVFITWQKQLLSLGFANRVVLIDTKQSSVLKEVCVSNKMKFIDNL